MKTRTMVLAVALGLALGAGAWAQDEEPAAEAPPVKRAAPAAAAEEEEEAATPPPKPKAAKPDAAPAGPLAAKVEKQGKELAALKKENDKLKEQVRLLYSIVNKLAGLNQGR